MLARWYLLLGQFSVTFEYRPGAQYATADGMSRQCGQCRRPDCLVSSPDSSVVELDSSSVLQDRPFALSEMGDSMDTDLLPELSGETWVASALLEELSVDLPTAGSDIDLIVASARMRRSRLCESGYSLEWFRLGRCALAFLRSYGIGDCRLATCLWTWTGDYGAVGLLRREFLSLLCQVGSVSR